MRKTVKRVMDLAICVPAVLVLAPVYLACGCAVLVSMGRPVIYTQLRVGLNGEEFVLWKFRTMVAPRPGENALTSDQARITPIGAFLRRTSLDEIPQFVQVLAGTMSLVGPRPLLPLHAELYNSRQSLRLSVPPGITGLSQVSGRQNLTFSERLELDVQYVETASTWLDLTILIKTIGRLFQSNQVINAQSIADVDDIGLLDHINAESAYGVDTEPDISDAR